MIQELDYLDTKILDIAHKLNNLSLENYTLTSEEISIKQEEKKDSSGGGQDQSKSSSNEEGQNGMKGQEQSEEENNDIKYTEIKLNSILISDENSIDWDLIKNDIERINEAWSILILDFSGLNIDNKDILDFSYVLNDCILSIKDENKVNTLVNIAKLYSFIPILERDISYGNINQNIKQVKAYIVNAYCEVEQNKCR